MRTCVHSISNNKNAILSGYFPSSQCMVWCIIQEMLPARTNTPKHHSDWTLSKYFLSNINSKVDIPGQIVLVGSFPPRSISGTQNTSILWFRGSPDISIKQTKGREIGGSVASVMQLAHSIYTEWGFAQRVFVASPGNSMHHFDNIPLIKCWSYDVLLTSTEAEKCIILVCSGRRNITAEHPVSVCHRLPSGHQILSSLFLLHSKYTHTLDNEGKPTSHPIITSS